MFLSRASTIGALAMLAVIGCGGAAASTAGPPSAAQGTVRADLACTESRPSGEADCVGRGCQWGPPLYCSGIARQTDAYEHDATRPCTCTCQADIRDCMSRP